MTGPGFWAGFWSFFATAPVTPPAGVTPADVLAAVNAERARRGRPPLAADSRLMPVSQAWADRCARLGFLTHGDFAGRVATIHPGAAAGEVIEEGAETAAGIVTVWLSDPPHRAILLDPAYQVCGVGLATGRGGALYAVLDAAD